MSSFDEIINDPHGKKVLMYLIAPRNTKHLQYDLVQLMKTSDALNTRYHHFFSLYSDFNYVSISVKKILTFDRMNYLNIANHIFLNILQQIFFQH